MGEFDPIALLFGGMEKLSPGGDEHTRHVLGLLREPGFGVVVDAGCGAGRQTLVLAQELGGAIEAVDSNASFLQDLVRRADAAGLGNRVRTHCLDMQDIPRKFPRIDLLWSEGAAYNIGFANALATWARAIVPGGLAVVSELAWLEEQAPQAAREFFRTGYPDMQSLEHNLEVAARAGYEVLATYTLPRAAWVQGYYDTLGPRARKLVDHEDAAVRAFAAETLREIETFEASDDSYGYVFYVLKRAD